jgi:hypothetical protein
VNRRAQGLLRPRVTALVRLHDRTNGGTARPRAGHLAKDNRRSTSEPSFVDKPPCLSKVGLTGRLRDLADIAFMSLTPV